MKKIFLALFATAALLGAGCAKIDVAEGQLNVPEGEMAVNLGISAPFGDAVRSYVSGTENPINGPIHMLCFDGEGKFIADRTGTVTKATDWSGTLAGTVPAITTRIHFIANFGSLDLSSFSVGSLERSMMKSEALSSGINDEVRFWGYHKAANSTEMMGWLTGGNTVKLLRDRAKVVLVKDLESGADAISELAWTVGNGVSRGFVAATSASGNDPYDNNYESNNRLTEFSSAGRYATMENTDAIWAGENEPQFLFENANTTSNPAKIIIKATYTDKTVKYHTVLLQSNENVPYPVVRNQTFKLTVKNLPKSVGSGNLVDALSTTNYSNNPYAQVAREVDEVNSEQFTLKVESVAKLFDNRGVDIDDAGNAIIRFTYTGHDGGSISSLTPANFDVSWEAKSSQDETDDVVAQDAQNKLVKPTVDSFNATTGAGTVTFPLATLSAALKHNTLQIVAKNSGLSRFVDVYSITSFKYATDPALKDNNTSRPVGSESREVYELTFSLPADLPESQYPLKVKLYSSTLVPFSDKTAAAPSGSFNVVVDNTASLSGSSQSTSWNFGAPDWGQYYEYVIEQKPSASTGNAYTIYLYDIVANYPSRDINTVGLYFQIDGFQNASNVSCIPLSCVYSFLRVTPAEQTVAWNTRTATFRVIAPAGTSWAITGGTGVTVNPSSGTGNRDITLSFGTNNTTAARNLVATVSSTGLESKTVTVIQTAGASFTASNFSFGYGSRSSSATSNGVKVDLTNSRKDGNYLTIGYEDYRDGLNRGTIKVTPPSGKKITSIVVTYSSAGYTYNNSQSATSDPASYAVSGATGTWTGTAASGQAVTITMGYNVESGWFSTDYDFPRVTRIDVSYE